MREITLIAHDIRSTHNVGALLRTADGLGISHVYFTGYTPYPLHKNDTRLPHISRKLEAQINKTALGAQNSVAWSNNDDVTLVMTNLKKDGFQIIALEQSPSSVPLPQFRPAEKVALLLGREVEGIDDKLLNMCDTIVEIPMMGSKESFNVVQAAAMTLYHIRYFPFISLK